MHSTKYNWFNQQATLGNYYQHLHKNNDVTQITVTNHTNDIQNVRLWGAISSAPSTDSLSLESSKTVTVKKQPQELVYNPANDLFYVIHQLSDSVSVLNTSGAVVTTIKFRAAQQLLQSSVENGVREKVTSANKTKKGNLLKVPSIISSYALAVNTKIDSLDYGTIAVASWVSNEVIFINTDNTIERINTVESRPIDILHSPVDDCYYTTNLVCGTISKICINREVNTLPSIQGARTIGVNTDNGDLYVHGIKKGAVNVYDLQGSLKGSAGSVNADILSFLFHPIAKAMYMVLNATNTVSVLDTTSFRTITKINTGTDAVAISYNVNNGLMYVANGKEQTFTRIDAKHQVVDTVASESFEIGLAISTKENLIAVSNAAENTITITTIKERAAVTINKEYYEYREDFQHNPTLISHLKIVASGEDRINALQLIEKSVTGKETCKTLSLSNHQSPQNFGNILEVSDINGDIIDGHSTWNFKINAKQVVTLLIYHKQFEMYSMLPEKSRISTGVQMSKGIPVSWLEFNKNEPLDESTY